MHSDAFRCIQIPSDAFRYLQMHSVAFRRIQTHWDALRCIPTHRGENLDGATEMQPMSTLWVFPWLETRSSDTKRKLRGSDISERISLNHTENPKHYFSLQSYFRFNILIIFIMFFDYFQNPKNPHIGPQKALLMRPSKRSKRPNPPKGPQRPYRALGPMAIWTEGHELPVLIIVVN